MALARTLGLATLSAVALAVPAASQAAVIAQWTFESSFASITGSGTSGPVVSPETGVGSFGGIHTSASSAWSSPAGPGSAHSYSSNNWAATGDTTANYYQFSTSATGYENLVVSFDATGSNTGPKNFKIAYSTDGSTFSDFGTYSLVNASWSSLNPPADPSTSHFEFDFDPVPALDGQSTVYFRLIQTDSTAINGTFGTGGTSRVDNVTVSGSLIPEPASMGLLAGAAVLAAARRRRTAI